MPNLALSTYSGTNLLSVVFRSRRISVIPAQIVEIKEMAYGVGQAHI